MKLTYCQRRGGNECAAVPVSQCPCRLYQPDPYPVAKPDSDPVMQAKLEKFLKKRRSGPFVKGKTKVKKTSKVKKSMSKKGKSKSKGKKKWGKIGAPKSAKRKAFLKSIRKKGGK
jgi:hypothetical protein